MTSATTTTTAATPHTLLGKKALPWWLSGPALLLFTVLLLVPLGLTAVLSFNAFDPATGVKAGEFTLEHYGHVFTDSYYHAIFWRTFWIAGLVTLICVLIGAPEAYVLSRMRNPWRSILLLVVLAPNDGRAALAEGERTGVDWPDHCMRLLPADETAMAELEAEDTAAEVAP